jgi:hypothetical protein
METTLTITFDFEPYCKTLPDPFLFRPLKNRRPIPFWRFWKRQRNYFEIIHPITVIVDSKDKFGIPAGFKTDLASIPGLARAIIPVVDSHLLAAVVHDFLYREVTQSWRGREFADTFFLRIMKETNVPKTQRVIIYSSVRAGGWASYQRSKRKVVDKKLM